MTRQWRSSGHRKRKILEAAARVYLREGAVSNAELIKQLDELQRKRER